MLAIKQAEQNMGDYMLKSDEKYVIPEVCSRGVGGSPEGAGVNASCWGSARNKRLRPSSRPRACQCCTCGHMRGQKCNMAYCAGV